MSGVAQAGRSGTRPDIYRSAGRWHGETRSSRTGLGYAATDLAALRHRTGTLRADRIRYVVDARQALHCRMVLAAGRRAGWLPDRVDARHVAFGTVLGPDGRPFKTRSGDTVGLNSPRSR